jgi:organic radical activating enzyme
MTESEVLSELRKLWDINKHPTIIVVSGGEPLMQQGGLADLAWALHQAYCKVHVETAGTIMPTEDIRDYIDQFVVSPKLRNSGNVIKKAYKPQVLRSLAETGAYFKFVVRDSTDSRCLGDFDEIDRIVEDVAIDRRRVMIMPEGTTVDSQLVGITAIADQALERGYGLSLRQHILIWGDKRGH